ncbi:MAG: hypothetical protein MUE40_13325 [Anaerolineae bacterium]|nr:hypothetical protein [Anaerolineae bacterium]
MQQLLNDMQADGRQAVLLLAQVGALPTELQVIVQVADYDSAARGLRPVRSYIVRVLGVIEHRVVNLGTTTGDVQLVTDHPLLYEYSQPPAALFFRGALADAHDIVLDIAQAHATTFQGWRHFPQYLNVEQPLLTLLQSGGGLLGQMPLPLAQRLAQVLDRHGLEHKLLTGEPTLKPPASGQPLQALFIGESYFVSFAFSVDEMGKTP